VTVIRKHLASPAMVVAFAGLIVALGGVSYAAGVLPKNSVGTAQLKTNAVTRAKLKKNAITGAKVKNGSLMAADFKAGQLPAGPQGPKGDPGLQGPKGDPGKDGAPGAVRAYGLIRSQGVVIQESKNLAGVRRRPGYPLGGFCVKVSPAAGIAHPNKAPSIAGGNGQYVVASTMPTNGNSCNDDEVAVEVVDHNGAVVDKDFTLLLP